jgi:RNA polymerase sigma-70 factor (ECF subfamily)
MRDEVSLGSLADAELVARCRTGDQAAWCELVERFSRYVHAIAIQAYRLSREDAEDVFQDVFARTYEQLDTLRDDAAIRPWIGQLTRRLCIDRLRRGSREAAAPEELEALEAEDVIALLDDSLSVHAALATLSGDCREILDRFFCRDESYLAIGEALGIPAGTIASRISRCLGRLRDAYEGRRRRPGASRR